MARLSRNAPRLYKPWLDTFATLTHDKSAAQPFADFCEMAALAISNRVDLSQFDAREARYLSIIHSYKRKKDRPVFGELLALLGRLFDEDPWNDHLAQLFQALELGNKHMGQFFTPYDVCKVTAGITLTGAADLVAKSGIITICEPACGAGGLAIAAAEACHKQKVDIQHCVHVTAVDVDRRCVAMCYVQLSLLGIPALVFQGNSITLETTDVWYTPAHVRYGWPERLRRHYAEQNAQALLEAAE